MMVVSSSVCSPEDSPKSSDEDSPMSSDGDSPVSSNEDSAVSSDEDSPVDSEVICSCGLPAKLIISMNRSPYRLFYNCPRGQYNQCGFRQWFDEAMPTDSRHVDQINLISIECNQIRERISKMEKERGQEWSLQYEERVELNKQLSAVKDELKKIESEMKPVNKSNPFSAGVKFQMPMSSNKDSDTSSNEGSDMSYPEDTLLSSPEGSSPENSEVMCFCMRNAKLRLSMTSRNPNRYFYHCPKRRGKQCGFFQWIDEPIPTGHRRVDEMNLISDERNRLQERINKIKEDWDHEKSRWSKDKMELHLELAALKDELDKIKSKIKQENDGLNKIKSSDEDSPVDSEVICSCGLPAKLIISMNRSPYKLFYTCPRGQYRECGFHQWFDEAMPTDSRHVDQINLISIECNQIRERISKMEKERSQKGRLQFEERTELNRQLSAAKDELKKIKSEMKPVNKSSPFSAGVKFNTMPMSSNKDSNMSSYEDTDSSSPEGSGYPEDTLMSSPEDSSPENSGVLCFCMRYAKLRLSMTSGNPNRYFYHCPKRRNKQCGFFQWIDEPNPTGNRRADEMNLISHERNRLQERINKIKEDWGHERSRWNKDKMELHLELSAVKDELDNIKSKIKQENDRLNKIKSEIKLENDGLVKIKSEIKLENDELVKSKGEIKMENNELDKIKSEIKLENDGLVNIKRVKLENDGPDKIWSGIKLENDGLVKIKRIKIENDGLVKVKSENKQENDGPDYIKRIDKLENESGSMPPLN